MDTQPQVFHDTDDLPPDTRLLGGQFVIDVRIGRGGAATVYAATTADGKDVALKVMSAAYAALPTARQRFRNEVATAQHLADHPGVVTPYAQGELPELAGRPYIAMPLVKGRSLVLLVGRLPVVEAVALMRDLARIVASVHERGIVHRDIKPANVIVRDEGGLRVPFLIDFGLAYSDGAANAPVTAGLTAAHELPGTKHYMAPEQLLGARPDPRFDVYALGVSLYEMLTGLVPLHELGTAEAARRKCDAGLPSLSIAGKVPGLLPELEQVIDAALEREPTRRTASARLLAEQLAGVLAQMERANAGVAGSATAAVATRGQAEGRWAVVAVGVVVAAVVLAGAAMVVWDPERALAKGTPQAEQVDAAAIAASGAGLVDAGPAEETSGAVGAEPQADVAREPVPEPKPEAQAEPEPEPAAQVEPRPIEGKRKGKALPKPRPPNDAVEPPCPDAAAEAQSAKRRRQWDRVLQLTKSSRCWDDQERRVRLHVEALVELGRYRECAAFRSESRDTEVVRLAKTCATQLHEERSP